MNEKMTIPDRRPIGQRRYAAQRAAFRSAFEIFPGESERIPRLAAPESPLERMTSRAIGQFRKETRELCPTLHLVIHIAL